VNEQQMIRNALAGDPDAQRELYNAHVDRVYRLAFRITGDGTMAEDLTQDTFIRAFHRLADFRGEGSFGGWIHRIATSVIFSALRKQNRIRSYETNEVDLELLRDSGGLNTENDELGRRLNQAISKLDPTHRLVFVMHDFEGFTHAEIGEAMDTPTGTVKARLSRARKKLRTMLSEYGQTTADLEMES